MRLLLSAVLILTLLPAVPHVPLGPQTAEAQVRRSLCRTVACRAARRRAARSAQAQRRRSRARAENRRSVRTVRRTIQALRRPPLPAFAVREEPASGEIAKGTEGTVPSPAPKSQDKVAEASPEAPPKVPRPDVPQAQATSDARVDRPLRLALRDAVTRSRPWAGPPRAPAPATGPTRTVSRPVPSWNGLRPVGPDGTDEVPLGSGRFIARLRAEALPSFSRTRAGVARLLRVPVLSVRSVQPEPLPGAVLDLDAAQRERVLRHRAIVRLTPDTPVAPAVAGEDDEGSSPPARSWALSRLSRPVQGAAAMDDAARLYVLDSGVSPGEGRSVRLGAAFVPVAPQDGAERCARHGSRIASVVAGPTGLLDAARFIDVRVLPCTPGERGRASSVVEGLAWVYDQEQRNPGASRAVVLLALSGPNAIDVNDWIGVLAERGVVTVAAAGNAMADAQRDACLRSPGSAPLALTVSALDAEDRPAGFAALGDCVDLWAPGVLVNAREEGETVALSGTSVAAALVAGALVREREGTLGARELVLDAERLSQDDGQGTPVDLVQPWPVPDERCIVAASIGKLNIRLRPSTQARTITQAPAGTPLQVTGRSRDWARVRMVDGNRGWAALGSEAKSFIDAAEEARPCRP